MAPWGPPPSRQGTMYFNNFDLSCRPRRDPDAKTNSFHSRPSFVLRSLSRDARLAERDRPIARRGL